MFEGMLREFDAVPVTGFIEGTDLLEGMSLYGRFGALLADMVATFDSTSGWDMDPWAATSMRTWLLGAGNLSNADASHWTSLAKWLRAQPVVLAAARAGDLSRGQVDAIRANVPAPLSFLFAEHAPAVVAELIGLSVADTARAMQQWRAWAEATLDPPEPLEKPESLFVSKLLDGRREITGHLDALLGKTLEKALELADTNDYSESPAVRRAQALADIAKFFLDHIESPRGRRNRPHAHLILDAASTIATYLDGEPIARPELELLLCDATIQRVLNAGSVTIDLGHDEYTVTKHVWDTIAIRDQRCRFDDRCTAKVNRCDAHHVVAYPAGPTDQGNLVLLCEKHHRRLHKPGWHGVLTETGAFQVTDPKGHAWITHPTGPTPHEQAQARKERNNAARAERARARARADTADPGAPPLFSDTN
jgi:hypothetical protein